VAEDPQNAWEDGVAVATGLGFTVTVTTVAEVLVQPAGVTAETVYTAVPATVLLLDKVWLRPD
jgi:hypothetical protein